MLRRLRASVSLQNFGKKSLFYVVPTHDARSMSERRKSLEGTDECHLLINAGEINVVFIFTIANLIQLRQWADLPKQQQQQPTSSLFDTSNGDDDDDFNPRAGGGAASGMTKARLTFPLRVRTSCLKGVFWFHPAHSIQRSGGLTWKSRFGD